jgi:hypothetical protein
MEFSKHFPIIPGSMTMDPLSHCRQPVTLNSEMCLAGGSRLDIADHLDEAVEVTGGVVDEPLPDDELDDEDDEEDEDELAGADTAAAAGA